MKLHLPVSLLASILGAWALISPLSAKTLHVYVLTGQSNSLGAVKGSPASAELQEQYSTAHTSNIQMWNGNVNKGRLYYDPCNLYEPNRAWTTVAPQKPDGSLYSNTPCMGPEYGFSYMMTKKGWQVNEGSSIAIVKSSLDGGGNNYWLAHSSDSHLRENPNQATPFYNQILDTVKEALNALDANAYDSIELSGLLYLQGESNNAAEANAAASRYSDLLVNLKTDLAAQGYDADVLSKLTVPFDHHVAGQSATWTGNAPDSGATPTTVTAKNLYALSQSREDVGWIFTRDLTKITSGDTQGVHYDGKSQITIGARYAYAMALAQGWDVGHVRSDYYNNHDYNGARVSLNDAHAWWSGQLPDADAVVTWDVSSANQEDTLSGDFAVGGIRVEDPYRDTVVIKNLGNNTQATLSLGHSGIAVQGSHLSLQTKVAATADQSWDIAAGKTLELTNGLDAAGHAISLSGGDGASVCLAGNAQIGALNTAENVALNIGTADATGQVSVDTLQLGASASISFSIVDEQASCLHVGQFNYTSDASTVTFTLDDHLAPADPFNPPEYHYTIGSGWDGWDINGTSDRNISYQGNDNGWTLTNNNGTLTLSSPSRSSLTVDAGHVSGNIYDVTRAAGKTSGYTNVLNASKTYTGGTLFYIGCNQEGYSGNVYAEARDFSATWLVAAGKTSAGNARMNVQGSYYVKVSSSGDGGPNVTYDQVFGACNTALDGDVYMEFDNAHATYNQGTFNNVNASISGAFNATANNVTLVFNDGTTMSDIVAARRNSAISGTARIEIHGGTVNGNIYGGSRETNSTVHESIVTITGGTVLGNIYGNNDTSAGGTVNLQGLGTDSSFSRYTGRILAGHLNLANSAATASAVTINGGALSVDGSSSLNISGNLAIASTGSTSLTGSGSVESGSLTVTASTADKNLMIDLDSLTVRGEGASQVNGTVTISHGAHSFHHVQFSTVNNKGINVSGGTSAFHACTFGNSASTTESGNAILWVNNGGHAILGNNTVVYGNAGVASGGSMEIAAGANVTAGKLYHSSTLTNNGSLIINKKATLTLNYINSAQVSKIQEVTNSGTLKLEGHTMHVSTLANEGTIAMNGAKIFLTKKSGQSQYSLGSLSVSDISTILMNESDTTSVVLKADTLSLSAGSVFSAYNSTTEVATTASEAALFIQNLRTEGAATLNANMTMGSAAGEAWTLHLEGAVEMGSTLSLFSGGAITLGNNIWEGDTATLFTSVDSLSLNGEAVTTDGSISAREIFSNAMTGWKLTYKRLAERGWTLSLTVPEPTTATLSLLALATLAARRRRRTE